MINAILVMEVQTQLDEHSKVVLNIILQRYKRFIKERFRTAQKFEFP